MTIQELVVQYRQVLEDIASGGIPACTGETWDECYAGNVEFAFAGWRFTIFNDCDSLDYTDSVTAPDGTTADFDQLYDVQGDPVCFRIDGVLMDYAKLEKQLKAATPKL